MKKYNFLAIDIGATSGRAVLGTLSDNTFKMQELHRFPNAILELHGRFYWDIYYLYDAIKESLKICAQKDIDIHSIGIDTWGVDFGYIASDGTLLGLPRAYRDPYTEGTPERYFQRIPSKKVYQLTGIQFMNFNSLFQLFQAKEDDFGALKAADKILFIPDLLSYMLTGNKVCEYTDASTSQLLNPETKQFEKPLFEAAGISSSLVQPIVMPGTLVGKLTDAVIHETGLKQNVPVIAVAGHDTASAVAAVPANNHYFAYLSSGTWSLMGIETENPIITEKSFQHNFTNEGGIDGTIRFLKNITGMWLLEQCKKEWEKAQRKYSYATIVQMAESATPFQSFINPDDPRFANPTSMTTAIADYCNETHQPIPIEDKEFIRCIFESLALRYREVLMLLMEMAPFPIRSLHIIGGGSKNNLLNQLTANAINMPVIAGPAEATAIGNCMIQARTAGLITDRWEMRKQIYSSFSPIIFQPQNNEEWKKAFKKYQSVTTKQ